MQIAVTFRHMDSTEALKNHVEERIGKLDKYVIKPVQVHIILSVEKIRQQCEIVLTASNLRATAVESSENLYAAIDLAVQKIERQLKKHKEILKDHKHHQEVLHHDLVTS